VRPALTTGFLAPTVLFVVSVVFLATEDQAYPGMTFFAALDALPISAAMSVAAFLVCLAFCKVQKAIPSLYAPTYFLSFPALGAVVLFIRQVFPIGAERPVVWDLVGNQVSFAFFVAFFTFAFNQSVGMTVDRLARENDRANSALAELERQHLQLIASQEEVRKELASFLHDGLQSNLVVLGLQMQNSMAELPEKYHALGASFIEEIERLRRVDVRSAIRQLSPDLDGISLQSAIRELSVRYESAMKVQLNLDSSSLDPALPVQLKLGVYRIVEQALLNAAVHGKAKEVSVTSVLSGQVLSLLVVNDGLEPKLPITQGVGFSVIEGWCKVFSGKWMLNRVGDSTVLSVTLMQPNA
jgi:signal transduction histidine kinase